MRGLIRKPGAEQLSAFGSMRKRWATMEELMSAGERKPRIIHDIIHDFGVQPRLNNDRGTAILVAAHLTTLATTSVCSRTRRLARIITSYEPTTTRFRASPKGQRRRYKFDTYTQHVPERSDHQGLRGQDQAALHR